MSSQHKRPLYAFVVLALVCGVFMGYSAKAQAVLDGLLDEGSALAGDLRIGSVPRMVPVGAAQDGDEASLAGSEAGVAVVPAVAMHPQAVTSRPEEVAPVCAAAGPKHRSDRARGSGKSAQARADRARADRARGSGKSAQSRHGQAVDKSTPRKHRANGDHGQGRARGKAHRPSTKPAHRPHPRSSKSQGRGHRA